MPRPPAVVGACKPFDSLLLSTTQGTGTQGKTCGRDPGVLSQPPPQEEEENAVHFGLATKENAVHFGLATGVDKGGGISDIMDDENVEFYNPSDDDDNSDLFPEDSCDVQPVAKKGRVPRFLCKRTRRMRKSTAKKLAAELAEEEEIAKAVADIEMRHAELCPQMSFAELCLPCEDEAYDDDILNFRMCSIGNRSKEGRVREAARPITIPLRNDTISVSSHGSTRSWLTSADDGSRSGAINNEDPSGAQTIPKPYLLSEIRGPKGITAAAMQIFPRSDTSAQPHSKYPAEMVRKACRNFERFYELNEGEAYEE